MPVFTDHAYEAAVATFLILYVVPAPPTIEQTAVTAAGPVVAPQ